MRGKRSEIFVRKRTNEFRIRVELETENRHRRLLSVSGAESRIREIVTLFLFASEARNSRRASERTSGRTQRHYDARSDFRQRARALFLSHDCRTDERRISFLTSQDGQRGLLKSIANCNIGWRARECDSKHALLSTATHCFRCRPGSQICSNKEFKILATSFGVRNNTNL